MSKNAVETDTTMTIWRRVAGWINTHAQTHSGARAPTSIHARTRARTHTHKHVRLIAFPGQQWFRERTSMLRYTYIVSLVKRLLAAHVRSEAGDTFRQLTPP